MGALLLLVIGVVGAPAISEAKQDTGSLISSGLGIFYPDKLSVVKERNDNNTLYVKNELTGAAMPIASDRQGTAANQLSDLFTLLPGKGIAVFHSWASNLVPGTPAGVGVYEKNLNTNDISLIKKNARFPAVSPDGKYIVYEYSNDWENELPAAYLYDTDTGKETFIAYTSGGNEYGWTTQEFNVTNTSVTYLTSYPYEGVKGFTNRTFEIPQDAKPIIIKGGKI